MQGAAKVSTKARRNNRRGLLATAIICWTSGAGMAQQHWPANVSTNQNVTWMRFIGDGGWVFAAAGVGAEVEGFIAWTDGAEGNNIEIVWYQREAEDHWSTWGWQAGTTLGAAGAWVDEHLGSHMVFLEDPDLGPAVLAAGNATAPQQMQDGLFVGDPAHPLVVFSPSPSDTIELLVASGYEAAPVLSALAVDNTAPCASVDTQEGLEAMLNSIAATFEITMFGNTAIVTTCAWPCKCTRTYGAWTPTPPGTWTYHSTTAHSIGTERCWYSRPATRTITDTGETLILCHDCGGTKTDPGPQWAYTEVPTGTTCVPPPP